MNLAGFDDDTAENIAENRRRFLSALGLSPESVLLATAWQVHGDRVKIIRTRDEALDGNGKFDALASKMENVFVGVKTADCVPVLIGDPESKSFAAVHAGWRGTSLSIVKKAVRVLEKEFNALAESIIAAIGPAAGPQKYEVGPEVIESLSRTISDIGPFIRPSRSGHSTINLPAINQAQLIDAGLQEKKIFTAPFCTMTQSDLFFLIASTARHLAARVGCFLLSEKRVDSKIRPALLYPRANGYFRSPRRIANFVGASLVADYGANIDSIPTKTRRNGDHKWKSHLSFINVYRIT